MVALLRWVAAGLVAAAPLALIDLGLSLPGPEGTQAGHVLVLYLALYLAAGAAVGLVVGASSLALGGLALDSVGAAIGRWARPLRADRARRAASVLVAPVVGVAAAGLLFLVNLRFFQFNNQGLAAALLVAVTAAVLGGAALAHRVWVARLEGVARRLGDRWPGWGDALVVWAAPGIGLVVGAAAGLWLRRGTALAENWEALDLAPYGGVLCLVVCTALGEVLARRRVPRAGLLLGGVMIVLGGACWSAALGSMAVEGPSRDVAADDSWAARLYLTLAERATDKDRDGYSPYFGHGDCDDADPDAFPGSEAGDDCGPAVAQADPAVMEALLRGDGAPTGEPARAVAPPRPDDVPAPAAEGQPQIAQPEPSPIAPTPEPPAVQPGVEAAEEPEGSRLERPYNVLLITIDTVRADHMGYQGYERDTTPQLDALSERAVVFERAYAPSNMTPASVPAMMSGLFPTELYRDNSHFIRFGDENLFLAEMLQAEGRATRAVLTHWYFERRKRSGLYQGFDTWNVVGTRWGKQMEDASTSQLVTAEAMRQLEALRAEERPWLLWAHYLDPHKWYVFHDGFEKRWGRKSVDRYDHELAYTDHHVGRLLRAMKGHPAAERTAIIVTSDHGEAFGEHGRHFHGFSMHENQLLVPLLVYVPGLDGQPRRVRTRVSLIDLAPTILDLMGVKAPKRLQGRSWGPDLLGVDRAARLIYAERPRGPHSGGLRALIHDDMKLLWRARGNRFELYDLSTDPAEDQDLMRKAPDQAERMLSMMQWMQRQALDNQGKVR